MNINNPTTFSTPAITFGSSNSSGTAGALRADDTVDIWATPSVALGTSAAAGDAATGVRSNSTLVAFDATAASSVPYGGTSGTGSINFAARRDHNHSGPNGSGVAKVWLYYNQVAASILDSYGVSSVTNTGTGDFTVVFSTAMGSVNYVPVGSTNDSGATKNTISPQGGGLATGSCAFAVRNGDNTTVNLTQNAVVIFGDQ